MNKVEIKYIPRSRYEKELHSVMLGCFPDFWTPRFAKNNFAFPYDVTMYLMTAEGKKAGQIGFHPYSFFCNETIFHTGGICDVGVLPEFRGRGYSKILLEFIHTKIIKKYDPLFIPLYTDKPDVYKKTGYEIYCSCQDQREKENFSGEEKFSFSPNACPVKKLVKKALGRCTEEELKKLKIRFLYENGHTFHGKTVRSSEVWDELFRDPESEWSITENQYSFFRKGVKLESYSTSGNIYPPVHGGHDGNVVMLKLCRKAKNKQEKFLLEKVEKKEFIFPLSDVF